MIAAAQRSTMRLVTAALLLFGAGVFSIHIRHPIDGYINRGWRETDVGGIARNFSREGMHILYPRIDWRGDGPGYVEGEFPLYPYLIAIGYRTIGFHEQIGRVISYLLTLATLYFLLQLAAFVLPPEAAVAGLVMTGLVFILAPLTNRLATAIQPEPLMLTAYVGAVYAYVRWLDDDRWWWYGWALVATAIAILAKLPAVHLGFVFVFLTLWRQGWRAFRRPRLWIFAVAAVAPGIVWYLHARGFWEQYGNSLGVSNHRHLVGLASFTSTEYLRKILAIDITYAWSAAGLLAVLAALALGPWQAVFGYGLLWYAGVLLYYLAIGGTSAEGWAEYYHVVSVPPIALLIGGAAANAWAGWRSLGQRARTLAIAFGAGLFAVAVVTQRFVSWGSRAILAAAAVGVAGRGAAERLGWIPGRGQPGIGVRASVSIAGVGTIACTCLAALLTNARQTAHEVHQTDYVALYDAAHQFAPLIPPGVLIAASGGACQPREESAGNEPWFFYWTDHKGFNLCADSQTVAAVNGLAARGARYFIGERQTMAQAPGFEADLRTHFPVLAENAVAVMVRLDSSSADTAPPHR